MKTRIVIADDHVSIRDMLVWILRREPDYEVVGEAGSGLEALKVCGARQPQVLILDLSLPCISGPEVLRRIRRISPGTRVMIYSGTCSLALIREALMEHPQGYVEKLEGLTILRKAIAAVAGGGSYFSPMAHHILRECRLGSAVENHLSPREREVLQMIAEGRSSKEISGMLQLALKTVENHRANLMAKLKMHDIATLTLYAARRGMVALE